MDKVLFIDIDSEFGHFNFNKLFIENLLEKNFEIDFALKENYYQKIKPNSNSLNYAISNYFGFLKGKMGYRINHILELLRLKFLISKKKYDYVIFSNFDEISLFFSFFKKNILLVDHGNLADSLNNSIKKFFLKRHVNKVTLIVFNDLILNQAINFGFKKVRKIEQGLPDKIKIPKKVNLTSFFNHEIKNILFVPHAFKYDTNFFSFLFSSEKFLKFIVKNDITVICKGHVKNTNKVKNIITLDLNIDKDLYDSILLSSFCVVLSYPKSFKLRVSAVMLECFSNNIPLILSDIESFKFYKSFFNYDPYFLNEDDFISKVSLILNQKSNSSYRSLKDLKFNIYQLFK